MKIEVMLSSVENQLKIECTNDANFVNGTRNCIQIKLVTFKYMQCAKREPCIYQL